jgi:catechol 2,3-dioxygenase
MRYTVPPPGYRLPNDTQLGIVRLAVADLSRSVAFYERVIGLRRLPNATPAAASPTALLAAQGDDTPLVELHEVPGATPVPKRGRLGLYHVAILLPDRAALGRFLAHLTPLGIQVGMADHGASEALYLTDPDGLGLEVYADRPRTQWQIRDGTLAMGTDPLYMPSVLRAAGGAAWTGAPPGTRIGHVHLFVDDLQRAAQVYHQGLGLDRVSLPPFPGALFLSAGGYHHHLGTNTWAARAPRAGETDARLLEWTVIVPTPSDVNDVATSLAAAGESPVRADHDLMLTDPLGIRVRITPQR